MENMAVEVGTLQGGQIAALQDGKHGGIGESLLLSIVPSHSSKILMRSFHFDFAMCYPA